VGWDLAARSAGCVPRLELPKPASRQTKATLSRRQMYFAGARRLRTL